MIIIFLPNIIFFLTWLYIFNFNMFFSFFLAILTYSTGSIVLYINNQYTFLHNTLNGISVIIIIENGIKIPFQYLSNQLLKIERIKKYYLLLKVKILLYLFNIALSLIPTKKENKLTEELQNDYLDILNRNKHIIKFENKTK